MLTRFILFVALFSCTNAYAFNSYEHSEIGTEAFESAKQMLNRKQRNLAARLLSGKQLSNKTEAIGAVANGKEFAKFTFGDLVAIYGDYAVSVEDLNNAAFIPRVVRLKTLVRGESTGDLQDEIKIEQEHSITLATNNPTHFSLRAAQAYTRWHRRAILLAQKRGRLWEALHYEALAIHSFTDLFAFGHLLDNRQLTDRLTIWAGRQKNQKSAGVSFASTASKAMGGYVNFFHNAYNWKGAMMQNLVGDSWRGFGDKKYRIVDSGCAQTTKIGKRQCEDSVTARQRQIIVHAVAISILDVFKSASGQKLKVGNDYRAMCHLPVKYWDTHKPIKPENQKAAVLELATAMKKQGRPLEKHGFDFDLGYLKFEETKRVGRVEYYDYIKQYCGLI